MCHGARRGGEDIVLVHPDPELPRPQDLWLSLLPFQIISATPLFWAHLPKRINKVMSWRSMGEMRMEDVGCGGGE